MGGKIKVLIADKLPKVRHALASRLTAINTFIFPPAEIDLKKFEDIISKNLDSYSALAEE